MPIMMEHNVNLLFVIEINNFTSGFEIHLISFISQFIIPCKSTAFTFTLNTNHIQIKS